MNIKKEMKKMESQQKAQDSLNQLSSAITGIDKMIDNFYLDAKEQLLQNNEEGFALIANSIFYFQDFRKMLLSIKVQFQTYLKTAQVMDTIEGLRPVLKQTAKTMDSYPSLNKNSKDFIKFKKSLIKGQLNMKAMSSMMVSINPAASTVHSQSDFSSLKERLLLDAPKLDINTKTDTNTSLNDNSDFFSEINK